MDQTHLYNGNASPGMMMGGGGHMYGPAMGMDPTADMLGMSSPNYMDGTFGMSHDMEEMKRRRIARACDMCRKKKIKCDGKMPACTHCLNYKTECVFTQVEKKRTPPKGPKYIEGLENRLARMEACLRLSGLLKEDENGKTDLGALEKSLIEKYGPLPEPSTPSESGATPRDKPSRHGSATISEEPEEEEFGDMSDLMDSLVTNSDGTSRFVGSSSGFSIFSQKGIKWIREKTGDDSFQTMVQTTSDSQAPEEQHTFPAIFERSLRRKEYIPLPNKKEAKELLAVFFGGFNRMFPLFLEPSFIQLVKRQYSDDPPESASWWAAYNVVIALSYRLRVMSKMTGAEDDEKAWKYLMNAFSVFLDLTMQTMDLLSVQALLGMSMFLQGTENAQPCFFIVAAAIRVAQSIGLHKKGSGFNLPPAEREQRKRVFWIAYIIDQDICLRSGRPPGLDNDDMNIELPDENPEDGVGDVPLQSGGKCNLFRVMAEFAQVESQVYKELYSNKGTRKSVGELLVTISRLDHQLEAWKDSIPIDFRPEHEIKTDHPQLILNIVMLHFAYLNCLMAVHRMSISQGYWSGKLAEFAVQGRSSQALNPRVFSSASICVSAARTIIDLLKYVPAHDCSSVWMALYFPVAALVTLFSNLLQNPGDLKARQDMAMIETVVDFLSTLLSEDQSEDNSNIRRTLSVCVEFHRIANAVLEKHDKEASARRKRKTHNLQGDPKLAEPVKTQSPKPPNRKASAVVTDPVTGLVISAESLQSVGPKSPSSTMSAPSHGQPSPSSWPADVTAPERAFASPTFDMNRMYGAGGQGDPSMSQFFHPQAAQLFQQHPFAQQQPYLPADLYQMPMTLNWDWSDMTAQMQFQGMDPNQQFGQQNPFQNYPPQ